MDINSRPSGRTERESITSDDESNPTSLPSKYRLKVPAVVLPREVASNRKMSCGVAEMPCTVIFALNDSRSVSASQEGKGEEVRAAYADVRAIEE